MRIKRACGPAPAWREPTEIDKAYAAGFFDGEGNICIAGNAAGGARRIYTVYHMRVGASQNDPAPLFWLRERWGGTVRAPTRSQPRSYAWNCFSRQALAFLRDVLPHLQVKRARAELAIAYQESVERHGRRGRTPERTAELAGFKARMNELNAA